MFQGAFEWAYIFSFYSSTNREPIQLINSPINKVEISFTCSSPPRLLSLRSHHRKLLVLRLQNNNNSESGRKFLKKGRLSAYDNRQRTSSVIPPAQQPLPRFVCVNVCQKFLSCATGLLLQMKMMMVGLGIKFEMRCILRLDVKEWVGGCMEWRRRGTFDILYFLLAWISCASAWGAIVLILLLLVVGRASGITYHDESNQIHNLNPRRRRKLFRWGLSWARTSYAPFSSWRGNINIYSDIYCTKRLLCGHTQIGIVVEEDGISQRKATQETDSANFSSSSSSSRTKSTNQKMKFIRAQDGFKLLFIYEIVQF